jgi:hypothetical protein
MSVKAIARCCRRERTVQHSTGTTVQDIAGRFNEGHCRPVHDIARCCRRELTVQHSTGTTVQDIAGRFNEEQCRPVEDDAGESRTVRDIAGHLACLGQYRTVVDTAL